MSANVFMTVPFRDPKGDKDHVLIRDLTTGGLIRTVAFPCWTRFDQSFRAPDRSLYVLGLASNIGGHISIGRSDPNGKVVTWMNPIHMTDPCDTYDFVTIDDHIHLVRSRHRGNCFTQLLTLTSTEHGEDWVQDVKISENAYLRGLQRTRNSWAYVGTPTRHGGECWFYDNKEHPSFRRVSRLFKIDGCWHYYGVTMDGKHVCLMRF